MKEQEMKEKDRKDILYELYMELRRHLSLLGSLGTRFSKMKRDMEIIPSYQEKFITVENFVELTKLEENLSRLVDKLYLYPYLKKDLNSKDEIASMKLQEMESILPILE